MLKRIVIAGFVLCLLATATVAAEVDANVSTRETYVGVPVVLQIRVDNAESHQPPTIPPVDGLKIESAGPPSKSSQTFLSIGPNGRQQTKIESIVYSYRVTPQREGAFTIPPVKVVADGVSTITKAVRIIASKSDTDDLMFVEVAGKERDVFVGEALDLTLRIWIRPFKSQEYQVSLSEANMWQLISNDSRWGLFEQSLRELAERNERPGGRPTLREDSKGTEREYLLYEVDATIYPDRPGQIEADDIRVIVNYPLELGRKRSRLSIFDDDDLFGGSSLLNDPFFRNFGSRIGITKSRPVVVEAAIEPITVKPIPTQGRPADYQGAVGQYSIAAEAKPTSVKVGDPVTLHIAVAGTGPLDRLVAPPIAAQQDLINDFKVPDEPLAGFVDRGQKIFTTSIRPTREGVTQIPPIRMSYFDPELAEFVTVASDPIPIEVEAADVLALDAIVGRQPAAAAPVGDAVSTPDDPLADLTLLAGDDLLRSVERPALISTTFLGWMILPPVIAMMLWLYSSRGLLGGLVSARRRFNQSLAAAESADDVGSALEQFLARRFRLPASRLTRDQTVGQLRAAGCHELAIRTERLYSQCEKAAFAAASGDSIETLKAEARGIVSDLPWPRRFIRPPTQLGSLSSTTTTILLVALAALPLRTIAAEEAALTLTADQQRQILKEALSIYAAAAEQASDEASRQQFARSADKFQLLVDAGVQNDRVFYNLGVAQVRAGRVGQAIANLRRALRLNPESGRYREALRLAEQRLVGPPAEATLMIAAINDRVQRWLSPHAIKGLFVSAWFAFWGVLSLRFLRIRFQWKTAALLTLGCAALTAYSYYFGVAQYVRDDTAVLVAADVSLRSSDGSEFDEIARLSDVEGRVVRVLRRRSDWIEIATAGGATGWIESRVCEEI